MRRKIAATCVAILVATFPTGDAHPRDADLLPDHTTCFETSYDDSVLKAHPLRQVTRIKLVRFVQAAADRRRPGGYMEIRLNVRRRIDDSGLDYAVGGFCRPDGGALLCRPQGRQGGWRVERTPGGLLVRNFGITLNPAEYDGDGVAGDAISLPPDPDDQTWLLGPSPGSDCRID